MMATLICPTCGRELEVTLLRGEAHVTLKGKPPETCCQSAATGGFKIVGVFKTEP